MATHRFHPTRYFNVIGTAEPCLRVADGDTLITDTIDASGLDAHEVAVGDRPNPMTGPFFVEGAEPGDTLCCPHRPVDAEPGDGLDLFSPRLHGAGPGGDTRAAGAAAGCLGYRRQ